MKLETSWNRTDDFRDIGVVSNRLKIFIIIFYRVLTFVWIRHWKSKQM